MGLGPPPLTRGGLFYVGVIVLDVDQVQQISHQQRQSATSALETGSAYRRRPAERAATMTKMRAYRAEDEDAVVRLWWNSWHSIRPGLRHPQPFDAWRTRWANEFAFKQEIVVAHDEDTIVGFAAADVSGCELTQIFVDPSRKGEGIGGQLLTWAKQLMPNGFGLHTLTDNRASRAFYEHHGLIPGDTRINRVNGMETVEYRWAVVAR